MSKPRVFVDADVLFAGSASPSEDSASQVVLRMAEITLVEAITSDQVLTEVERNLQEKAPGAIPSFKRLVKCTSKVVKDPSASEVNSHLHRADYKDVSILVAALSQRCSYLLTFNVQDFEPGHPDVEVLRPGEFLGRVRHLLSSL